MLTMLPLLGGDPVSLRMRCESADLIAVVILRETAQVHLGDNPDWPLLDQHKLEIVEIWQGECKSSRIIVQMGTESSERYSAKLIKGKERLIFLTGDSFFKRNEEIQSFSVWSIHNFDQNVLAAYRDAVEQLVEIRKIKEEKDRDLAIQEWITQLAINPITRWEGAIELNQMRILRSLYSIDKWNYGICYCTEEQKKRLVEVLVSTEEFGNAEATLLESMKYVSDPRLIETMLQMAEAPSYRGSMPGNWLAKAIKRSGSAEAREMLLEEWEDFGDEIWMWWCFWGERDAMNASINRIVAAVRDEEKQKVRD